jgi:hypothetical protein
LASDSSSYFPGLRESYSVVPNKKAKAEPEYLSLTSDESDEFSGQKIILDYANRRRKVI